jgi:PKD domain
LTAALVASSVSGTAPLAVHFDATGTASSATGVDAFRQVAYSFDFGDERGLSWSVSGLPKNKQTGGPIAGHVFDVPGTYTVQLVATDASGNAAQARVSITVQDPDTVYSGAKTVCISLTTDFSGCPNGAAQRSTLPSGTQWNGTRVLFRRGQDFTSLGSISIQDGNTGVQVGAFGTGAKPIVHSVGVGDWRPSTANFANDVTVMDLQTRGAMNGGIGQRFLFYRNDLSNPRDAQSGMYFGDEYFTYDDPYRSVPTSSFYISRELFYVENTLTGSFAANANAYGLGAKMIWLGNDMGTSKMHNLRIVRTYKTLIAHNRLRGISSDGIRHSLKIHGGGLTDYADSAAAGRNWSSRYGVVVNNEFGSSADNNQWTVAITPQNGLSAEGVQDFVIANNKFIRGTRTATDLVLAGRRLTYRSNTYLGGAISSGQGHDTALPADWKGPYLSN